MSSSGAEGLDWWNRHVQQRRQLQRSRVGIPLPKHKQQSAYILPDETQLATHREDSKTAQPRLQDGGVHHRRRTAAKPRPPPEVNGWTPPPGRIACSIIASQEMQAFYARKKSYLCLLGFVSVEHMPRSQSHRSMMMRAASMRSSAKGSNVQDASTEQRWARQHAADNVQRWAQHTAEASQHVHDNVPRGTDHGQEHVQRHSTTSSTSSSDESGTGVPYQASQSPRYVGFKTSVSSRVTLLQASSTPRAPVGRPSGAAAVLVAKNCCHPRRNMWHAWWLYWGSQSADLGRCVFGVNMCGMTGGVGAPRGKLQLNNVTDLP